MSVSPVSFVTSVPTWAAASHFTKLVKKIGTSPSSPALVDARQRKTRKKKATQVLKEIQRYARGLDMKPICMTLTYGNDDDYSSKHISAFFDKFRRWAKAKGVSLPYAWVLERAGRLHYHCMIWMPRGVKVDFSKLKKWWPWGATWLEKCHSVNGWGKYMTKFNAPSAPMPKGARVLGYGGIDAGSKRRIARAGWPWWLQTAVPMTEYARRLKGGGWVNLDTGEVLASPYIWRSGRIVLKSSCTPTPV